MKASVFVATSLDGYIARSDGGLDWLPGAGETFEGEDYGFGAFFSTVDVVVIGRHTFEKVLTFLHWPYGEKPVVILTSRSAGDLPRLPAPTAEYMTCSPGEVAARLEERGARHLYVDGGITVQRFLDAGLIDRVMINRIPIVLGGGIPLFGPVRRDIHLRHVSTRQYPNGFVQSEYEVLRA
jgi:dihydrofolate reductase